MRTAWLPGKGRGEEGVHTYREIMEQFAAWEATLDEVLNQKQRLERFLQEEGFHEAIFTGCGSSYYSSLAAAAAFQAITGIRSSAFPASEIFLYPERSLVHKGAILLAVISRSGETIETLQAVETFRQKGGENVLAITCYQESALVKSASLSLVAREAEENSIVQTRSFSSMLLAAHLFAAIAAGRADYQSELEGLPTHGVRVMEESHPFIQRTAEDERYTQFFFLGSGGYYGLACEASLKMKEMSLSQAEAFHSLEFRHGPKSMLAENSLVIALLSDSAMSYEVPLLAELRGYGAQVLALVERRSKEGLGVVDYVIPLHSGLSELARGLLFMPPLQLLGYYRAMAKGLDPDRPAHLDPVVRL